MMLALIVVAALWIVAGALVLISTRKPAEIADLALSQNIPVITIPSAAVTSAAPAMSSIAEPLAA